MYTFSMLYISLLLTEMSGIQTRKRCLFCRVKEIFLQLSNNYVFVYYAIPVYCKSEGRNYPINSHNKKYAEIVIHIISKN